MAKRRNRTRPSRVTLPAGYATAGGGRPRNTDDRPYERMDRMGDDVFVVTRVNGETFVCTFAEACEIEPALATLAPPPEGVCCDGTCLRVDGERGACDGSCSVW